MAPCARLGAWRWLMRLSATSSRSRAKRGQQVWSRGRTRRGVAAAGEANPHGAGRRPRSTAADWSGRQDGQGLAAHCCNRIASQALHAGSAAVGLWRGVCSGWVWLWCIEAGNDQHDAQEGGKHRLRAKLGAARRSPELGSSVLGSFESEMGCACLCTSAPPA